MTRAFFFTFLKLLALALCAKVANLLKVATLMRRIVEMAIKKPQFSLKLFY